MSLYTSSRPQLLIFLLFFCVTDLLSILIQPPVRPRLAARTPAIFFQPAVFYVGTCGADSQEADRARRAQEACLEVLRYLADSPDWLLLFKTPAAGTASPSPLLRYPACVTRPCSS